VRFLPRFVPDAEIPALFRRADIVVLPYREIDQSGVLFTALGAGTPLVLSAVGGFPEVAADGAAELVPPGDAAALRTTLARLLADPAARERLAAGARRAAAERYGWDAIARRHLDLYARLAG
jgi:glycosyltransferase involved in cell wall biosynthesis